MLRAGFPALRLPRAAFFFRAGFLPAVFLRRAGFFLAVFFFFFLMAVFLRAGFLFPAPAFFFAFFAAAFFLGAGLGGGGIDAKNSSARRIISPGATSSLWVAMDHTWPKGSSTWP